MTWPGWLVIDTVANGVHVVPSNDGATPAAGHQARILCAACSPLAVRDAPLEEPVWSHHEPGWPGGLERRAQA